MQTNTIEAVAGGTMFAGPKAVEIYRIIALRSAIGVLGAGLKLRQINLRDALKLAAEYTGAARYTLPRDPAARRAAVEAIKAELKAVADKRHAELKG